MSTPSEEGGYSGTTLWYKHVAASGEHQPVERAAELVN